MITKNRKLNLLIALWLAGSSSVSLANSNVWIESQQFEAKGEYAAAAALLVPLLQEGDDKEFGYLRYGWLNYLQGYYDASIGAYSKALQLNPQSIDAQLAISLPLLAELRWQDAALHLKQVLAVSPWDYTANLRLMIAEEGQQKWGILANHANELSHRYPNDAGVLVYLARANAWLGNKDKAKESYKQVLMRIPNHIEARHYLQSLGL